MTCFLLNLEVIFTHSTTQVTHALLHSWNLPNLRCTVSKHCNKIVPEDLFMLYVSNSMIVRMRQTLMTRHVLERLHI